MVRLTVRDVSLTLLWQKILAVWKEQGMVHTDKVGVETMTVSATRFTSAIRITASCVDRSFWITCWAGEKEETCTSTSPASPETEHPPPVLVAPESETWTEEGWEFATVANMSTTGVPPNSENSTHYFGMETPLCRFRQIGTRQVVCYHVQTAWNVSCSDNYVLSL